MKMKVRNYLICWAVLTAILAFVIISGIIDIHRINKKFEMAQNNVESQMVGLPVVSVIEKEEIVEIEKEVEVQVEKVIYKLPFETESLGEFQVIGSCSDCLPSKYYPRMRSRSDITVFASQNTIPEGTLVYIDGVGIRQVQRLSESHSGVYVYFDSHEEAVNFGEQTIEVLKILD